MGWSRQAYYQQIKAEAALHERDAQVVELVREVRRRQPRIGVRKLHHMLRRRFADKRIKLGRDGMFATLKRAHLLVPTARCLSQDHRQLSLVLQASEPAQGWIDHVGH